MTLLCDLATKPGRPAISFVGHFGGEAFSLVSNFVSLVNDDSIKAAHDEMLQMLIFEFTATIIVCQPGLAAMFLTGLECQSIGAIPKAGTNQDIPETSILFPMTVCIKKWSQIKSTKPSLLAACLHLFHEIWCTASDHQLTAHKLRKLDYIWDSLIAIATFDVGSPENSKCRPYCYFQIAQSYALRILASECHYLCYVAKDQNATMKKLVGALKDHLFPLKSATNTFLRKGSTSFIHNSSFTDEVIELFSKLQPSIDLAHYRSLNWNDPFDPNRIYGKSYVYNVQLFADKLQGCTFEDDDSVEICNTIMEKMALLNIDWSRTDSQLVMVRSYAFAVRVMLSHVWVTVKDKNLSSLTTSQVFNTILELCDLLREHNDSRPIHVAYKTELASLIVFMVGQWIPYSTGEEDLGLKLVELLEKLEKALLLKAFPLGPAGQFSAYSFHSYIIQSILLTLQAYHKLPISQYPKRLLTTLEKLVPAIFEGLYYVMIDPNERNSQERSVLLCIVFELCRADIKIPISIWIDSLERYHTIPLLINFMSGWQILDVHDIHTSPLEQILEILISLSSQKRSAELLHSHGIMSAFCNNTVSTLIIEGKVQTYSPLGRTQLHRVWSLMIATVSQLMSHLKDHDEFVNHCVGFVRLFGHKLITAFDLENPRLLSLGSIDELNRITGLFFSVANAIGGQRDTLGELLSIQPFQEQLLRILSLFSSLLNSPYEFASRIKNLPKEQRGMVTDVDEFKTLLDIRLLSIIRNIMSFIYLSSNAESTLLSGSSRFVEVNMALILQPNMTSYWDQLASFGTLFDLIRFLTHRIRKIFESSTRDEQVTSTMILIIESCLSVLASQTIVLAQLEDEGSETRKEMTNEYLQTLKELKTLLNEAAPSWNSRSIHEAKDFICFLQKLGISRI